MEPSTSSPHVNRRGPNLYEYLQVSPRAESIVIVAAYRALARSYHPDVNQNSNATRAMREINAAYHVLSDPERRARYDAHRAQVLGRARGRRASDRAPAERSAPSTLAPAAPPSDLRFRSRGGARPVIAAVILTLLLTSVATVAVLLIVWTLDDRPIPPGPQLEPLSQEDVRLMPLGAFGRLLDGDPRLAGR